MKPIEFTYREERLRTGEVIFRPVAQVYLLNVVGKWIPAYFYIDSGADYTLVPYRMGNFLGLGEKATEVTEIGGIGGIIGVRFATITMKIGKCDFDCMLAWAQIEHVPFLLGRHNVFDHFKITFSQKIRKVIFTWEG